MKFKDLLRLHQEELLPNAVRVRKNIAKRRGKTLRLVLSCSAAAVLVLAVSLAVWIGFSPNSMLEEEIMIVKGTVNVINSIVPSVESDLGVGLDSVFVVETSESISEDEMRARLAISPKVPFEVDEVEDCRYEVRFEEGLEADTLYKVSAMYNGTVVHRWAFQTENTFSVTNSYPADNDTLPVENAIEFTFSHRQVTGVEEAFSIVPKVEGTFKQYGRRWAFIPDRPLKSSTHYTVTLDSSLKGPGDTTLKEDYRITFRTNDGDQYLNLIYKQNELADTYLVDEPPIAAVTYNGINAASAKVRVYAFEDSEAYISAYKNYVKCGTVSNAIDALAKKAVMEFDAQPVLVSDYSYYGNAAFIDYPEPLAAGYYFAEIEIDGLKVYQMLQSTTLSVYTLSTNGDYVVWVNDAETGDPLSGIDVTLDGFDSESTNSKGVVEFADAEKAAKQRFLIVDDDTPYVVVLNGEAADKEINLRNTYYSYVTTNSALYRSGDTVGIFGAVIPRMADADVPDTVTLNCDLFEEPLEAEVESDGTFQAEAVILSTASTNGFITLEMEECWLNSVSFNVADYHLPEYAVSVSTDKSVYMVDDTVHLTAQVTYMDGTPAPGVTLGGTDEFSGVSDENGCVYFETFASVDYEYTGTTGYPEMHYFECYVTDGEEVSASGSVQYLVLASPYTLEASYQDGNLTVHTNHVKNNISAIVSPDDVNEYAYDLELLKGEAMTTSVWVDLHEITYTKEIAGSTYDPINKTVEYTWDYTEHDTVIRSFEINCENGIGKAEIPEHSDRERRYYVSVGLDGPEGFTGVETYLNQNDYANQYLSDSYRLVADENTFDIGDTAAFHIYNDGELLPESSGRTLYTVVSGGVMELYQSEQATFELEFKKEYAPDVCVYGAYFDGKHIYSLGFEYLEYDLEQSHLNIEMTAEQEEYGPGDEVDLSFKVTDINGRPVETALNISVLDRALYLMESNADDPLYTLMNPRSYVSWVYVTTSHYEFGPDNSGFGEGGGDGEFEARSDFEDAPCFETIRTDDDGIAEISFTLPDTLTEWKIIAKAISEDAEAGCEVFDLLSTQDFFVSAAVGDVIKTSDDCTVAVKCDGTALAHGAICNVEVKLTDADGKAVQTLTAETAKSKYCYLNFGKLEKGIYSLVVSGDFDEYTDRIVLSIEVVENTAAVWITDRQAVEGTLDLSLTPAKGGVTLTIADEELAFWQDAMSRLKSSFGNRPDQVLGQYLADQFYSNGVWMGDQIDYSILSEYLCYDGVAFNRGAQESDLQLSAKIAAVAPEFCNSEWLANGFYYYVENSESARVDVLTAYFGLAAVGEPVLLDIQAIYETEADLSAEENVYLALAFAYAGDFDTAQYIFESELEGLLVQENDVCYVVLDGASDEALTGNCALLCNHLSLDYCEGLIRYIVDHDSEVTLLNLELISYLNDHLIETVGENKVAVTVGGETNEYSYFKQQPLVLQLTAEQAASVSIEGIEGNSVVAYSYYGAAAALVALGGGEPIGLDARPKTIGCDDEKAFRFGVDIPEDFENASLNLTMPVGLRLVEVRIETKDFDYIYEDRYHTGDVSVLLPDEQCSISVIVRGALPGQYRFEPFMVVNGTDNRYLATAETTITVTE